MIERDLVVVGGGPAGMAAALSAHDNGVKDILLLERDQYLGGILNQCIHTGFGLSFFREALTGPEYAERFVEKIRSMPDIEVSPMSFAVRLTADKIVTYIKPGVMENVKAGALIMATGCRERTREMIHIAGARPAGIFSAGLAQKLINIEGLLPGREVVIAGSGDIGMIMARRFILEGAKVKGIIEIQAKARGLMRNFVQCVEDFDIPVYFRHKISRIYGGDRVEAVEVAQVGDDFAEIPGSKFRIGCDTLLISVGLIPENELIEIAGAKLDEKTNSPITDEITEVSQNNGYKPSDGRSVSSKYRNFSNKTSIPGLFVCGNAFKVYDVADSVTADSITTGRLAAEYLKDLR